jgi:hypothetical protein
LPLSPLPRSGDGRALFYLLNFVRIFFFDVRLIFKEFSLALFSMASGVKRGSSIMKFLSSFDVPFRTIFTDISSKYEGVE